ncbi:MAG: FtsX-like permease family protein, partial [Candidatus Acidiferrales bacterium]
YTSLRDEIKPTVYIPWSQELQEVRSMTFEMRAAGNPGALAAAVLKAVRSVESNLPVFDVKTQIDQSDETLRVERLFARLLSFFGALALLLAAVGIYGVIDYTVRQRTQELGIRMALGAQRTDVLRLVVGKGMVLVLMGVVLGIGVALGATHLLSSLLFGVTATDPLTFGGIALALGAVAVLACYLPARRAARTSPLVALRYE